MFAEGNSTDSINVVRDAADSFARRGLSAEDGDEAYAVIDTDFGKGNQLRRARQLAESVNVSLILSNPCIEVWFSEHFSYSTRPYKNSREVISSLQKVWPEYSKEMLSFDKVMRLTKTAITNAEKLKSYHLEATGKDDVIDCNPSTDMYRLVQKLI